MKEDGVAEFPGMLDIAGLEEAVAADQVDTVVVAFTDLYGRLMGKRLDAGFFLESALSEGTHACDYLLTADSATDLEIDLIVEQGYGFSRQEERNNTPPGFLPIDAMFSPIVNVAFAVEDHRVGQQTDLDQVSLEIWTDGSIHPSEAMQTAADILIRHLRVVSADTPEVLEPVVEEVEPMSNAVFESSVEDLDLNVRTYNCLKRVGIATIGELVRMMEKGREEMLAIRNFGEKSLDELVTQLRKKDMLRLPGVNLDEYLEPEDAEEDAETAVPEAEAVDADVVPAPVPSVSEPEAA